jgi:myo-inositol catabolism protein IolC
MQEVGYNQPLYILPFDHRATFAVSFGYSSTQYLSLQQRQMIRDFKILVYRHFKEIAQRKVPLGYAGILCDEEFGSEVLQEAKRDGFLTILTTEKSGQNIVEFEYGQNFNQHINKFMPNFAKSLTKFNPDDQPDTKEKQKRHLKILSDFCRGNNYKFMLEVLVLPTERQLSAAGGSSEVYDKDQRADLTVRLIHEMQDYGIEADVWKLEGFAEKENYLKLIPAIQRDGRKNVGLVVLGRGSDELHVETWLNAGAGIPGVIGFAVGRTVFWNAWEKFYRQESDRESALNSIPDNFMKFYNVFTSKLITNSA